MARMDKRTLLREVTRIVKADPNKVARCVYALNDGNPECVAGVWFAQHGVDVIDLPADTVDGVFEMLSTPSKFPTWTAQRTHHAFASFDVGGLSPAAARLLNFIQAVQDDRFADAARTVTGLPSYTDQHITWRVAAQQEIGYAEGDHPTWAQALALTVSNYDKF